MKGLIVTAIVGLVFFGGAYAYSTMKLVQEKANEEENAEEEGDDIGDPENENPADDESKLSPLPKPPNIDLPVPFPAKAINEKVVIELTNNIKLKEQALKRFEAELNDRQNKMEFMLHEIKRERREYESVVKEAQEKILEGQRILQLIETKHQRIENDLKTINTLKEKENLDQDLGQRVGDRAVAKLMESFQPESLANTLIGFANRGELERAGEILSELDQAKAAKVIEAITDPKLQFDVIDAVRVASAKRANEAKMGQR